MDRKIRIAQYGCGKMSHYLMRYVLEKGGELVAAFDMNPAMIGTDIGTHLGMEKLGITISDAKDASEILSKEKPDVCIIATRSTMAELKEAFSVCAQNGINAISTCEEALYPWNSSKEITGMQTIVAGTYRRSERGCERKDRKRDCTDREKSADTGCNFAI